MTNNNRSQHFVAFLLIILLVIGVFVFLNPLRSSLSDLRSARDSLLETNQALEGQLADLQEAQMQLENTSEVKQSEFLDAIPPNILQDRLIQDITAIAKEHGITLFGLQFGLRDLQSDPKEITISASFQGNYVDLIDFLKDVESNRRRIHVRSISVQLLPETNGLSVNFSLDMTAYYQ